MVFSVGLVIVVMTIFSALSTFVLTRAARSWLNRVVFGIMRGIFEFILRFTRTYEQRDAIMAYYSPISLIMLVPVWYALILTGYAAMYWSFGVGGWFADIRYSGSSLLTLGFATSDDSLVTVLSFSEALIGLLLVALLMAYLPTMYAAFSRREQAVSMLEVRAGNPPSALEMLLRFNRIHGLAKLGDYWRTWEAWFSDVEESHTTLPALVFFRSPRAENSWITSAGAVLDTAALTLSSIDIPYEPSAALSIRAGFLALRGIADYFDISYPRDPHFPTTPIAVTRQEYDDVINKLAEQGIPIKSDREQAWIDFAGWRVNYDRVLLVLCTLVMAPQTPWSSDRAPKFKNPPIFFKKKKHHIK
ncbi:MAG TPA: hypothetical protein VFI68_13005 [Anaerolineales bacterium]|nr:hypothetical protein [Anaerolineales bacterium]